MKDNNVCTHCYGTGKDHGDESMIAACPSCGGMIKSKESIELQNRISSKFGFKMQTKVQLDPLEEVMKIAK